MAATHIVCEVCHQPAPKRGPGRQKYCRPCSIEKDRERKAKWRDTHGRTPEDPEVTRRRSIDKRKRMHRAGAAVADRRSATWMADDQPSPFWIVRVSVPFTYAFSKNHIWRMTGEGHVELGDSAREAKSLLASTLKSMLDGRPIVKNRLWLDILVQKPNHRGDAVNVVNSVCDAVQDATGLNDRWYSIRRLDWEVVKDDPQLIVGIGQDTDQHAQPCSYCGRLLPYDQFGENRSTRTGRARGCRDCSRAAERLRGPR